MKNEEYDVTTYVNILRLDVYDVITYVTIR